MMKNVFENHTVTIFVTPYEWG